VAGPIRIAILADGKKARTEIGEVDSKLGRLAKGGLKLAGAGLLGLGAGVVAAGAGLLGLAKGAAEDDKAQKTLARTLKNSAKATNGQVAALEDYISKTGVATGVTDDEMRPALGALVRATHDVSKAQSLMNLAMNVSAGTGKDLTAVTAALAKGQLGSTGALAKLGVATKDSSGKALTFDKIVQNLTKTFKGQAATAAGTLEGKWSRLKLILAETGETIGGKVLPKLTDFADFVLQKVVPAAGRFGTFVETDVTPKLKAFATDALPKVKSALSDIKTAWDDNKPKIVEFVSNTKDLADTLDKKLTPAVQRVTPPLQALGRIDLTNATNSVKALGTLISKGDGTVSGPGGIIAKLQSIDTIASRLNPAQHLATLATQAVTKFGDVFVTDATVRAKVAGWMGRNFAGLTSLLPLGQLATVGAVAANAVARAFGSSNPAGSVATFMTKLGRLAIQYNPVAVAQIAGRTFGNAVSSGILNAQPTAGGRARAFALFVGRSLVGSLPFGQVFSQGSLLGGRTMDGLKAGLSRGVSGALGVVRSIPGRLASAGGNWGSALFGAGKAIIGGLADGIRSAIPSVTGLLQGLTSKIPSWKGPASRDRTLLTRNAQLIMGSLFDGIEGELPKLKDLLGGVGGQIQSGLSAKPVVDLTTVGSAMVARTAAAVAPVTVNVYALADGPEVGRRVVETIKDYEQFNGASWRSTP
jgi:hypothetical protein